MIFYLQLLEIYWLTEKQYIYVKNNNRGSIMYDQVSVYEELNSGNE